MTNVYNGDEQHYPYIVLFFNTHTHKQHAVSLYSIVVRINPKDKAKCHLFMWLDFCFVACYWHCTLPVLFMTLLIKLLLKMDWLALCCALTCCHSGIWLKGERGRELGSGETDREQERERDRSVSDWCHSRSLAINALQCLQSLNTACGMNLWGVQQIESCQLGLFETQNIKLDRSFSF